MKFKFNLRLQELVDLYTFNTWEAPWRKKSRQRLQFFLPLAFILFAVSLMIQEQYVAGGILIVFAVIWFFIYDTVYKKRVQTFAKSYYNQEANRIFFTSYEYEFKDNLIKIKTDYSKVEMQYQALIDIAEREDVFWLFQSMGSAHIIPKRVMQPEQINTFRNFIIQRINP